MVNFWGWLVVQFKGKNVAILGPRGSGKTTLYDFLDQGTVGPEGTREQTVGVDARPRIYRKEFGLAMHKGYDVPGSDAYYQEWERIFQKADIAFYLFDVHLLRTDHDYWTRVSQDGKEIVKWGRGSKKICVLGTHLDTDPLARSLSQAEYQDKVLELDVVEALRSRTGHGPIAFGEMATNHGATTLLKAVLQ